jgi:hypothetical protein
MNNPKAAKVFPLAETSIAEVNQAAVDEVLALRHFGVTLKSRKAGELAAKRSMEFAKAVSEAKSNPLKAIWMSVRMMLVLGDHGLRYITTPAATHGYTFVLE